MADRTPMKPPESAIKAYFTPHSIADFMAENSQVRKDAKIIDPAAGEGVFVETLLSRGYRKVWAIELENECYKKLKERLKSRNGFRLLAGDALDPKTLGAWSTGSFDVVVGNPPFSHQRGRIEDPEILKHYELGRPKQAVEILFLERFIQLARPTGLVRIILPMNILANTNLQYVRDFILKNLWVEAVISLPRHTFGGTSAKTAVLFGQKKGKHWKLGGGFWSQNGVRVIRLPDLDSIEGLKDLSMGEHKTGLTVMMGQMKKRMDPDYHFANREISEMLRGSKVPFQPLSALVDVRTGFAKYGDDASKILTTQPRGKKDRYIRLLKAKNLSIYGFDFRKHKFFLRRDQDIFRSWACVDVGDVMVVRVGAGCVGRAVAVIDEKQAGQADDWILIVKPKRINPSFLAFYLNSSIGRAFVMREAQGTGALSISKGKLLNVKAPMLPEQAQARFETELREMYGAFDRGAKNRAESIFKSLEEELSRLVLR
ncbi:N-6 DNA methylase [bacterium]|nr:N-6 DNA methylase [bacterium]